MKRKIIISIISVFIMLTNCLTTASADTSYTTESVTTVKDGQFNKMGRILITGTTTFTFNGEKNRVEFRLPSDFYITSVGREVEAPSDCGAVLRVVRGFENNSAVNIRPIAEDPYNDGHYGGFELEVTEPSGFAGNKPEIIIYFDNVYVPRGYRGNVNVSIEPAESSGFSSRSITIANVAAAKLDIKTENIPSLTTNSLIGPIVISENISGAFEYAEFGLPAGFSWDASSATIDSGLGLKRDYDGDGTNERDFNITTYKDKYGYSVLRIELDGTKSTSIGTLRLQCSIDINDELVTHGDVNTFITGSVDPNPATLKIGTYNTQTVSITTGQSKTIYSGLKNQEIGDIIFTENAPGAFFGDGRSVILELPKGAEWSEEPLVQIEGETELVLGLNNGRAFKAGNDKRGIYFYIANSSQNRAGKVLIKNAKVNIPIDVTGEFKIKVRGSAGASGEITAATIGGATSTAATSAPTLSLGGQNQIAGGFEIKETAAKVLLARELWVQFPSYLTLAKTPDVSVTSGNLIIGEPLLEDNRKLIVPIKVSSTTASSININNIIYNINSDAPTGEVEVLIGGPAVIEDNRGEDWASRVVNATVSEPVSNEPAGEEQAQPITAIFKLGEQSYQINGEQQQMDVTPYTEDGYTYLPLRYAGLALGVDPQILWDEETKTCTLFKDNIVVQVKLGEKAVHRSGAKIITEAAAHAKDGRIMVPLRAVATAFGAQVEWDNETKTITITGK